MAKKTFDERVNEHYDKIMETDRLNVSPQVWSTGTEEGVDFTSSLFLMADDGEVTRYDIGTMLKDYGVLADASYVQHFVAILRKGGHKVA